MIFGLVVVRTLVMGMVWLWRVGGVSEVTVWSGMVVVMRGVSVICSWMAGDWLAL